MTWADTSPVAERSASDRLTRLRRRPGPWPVDDSQWAGREPALPPPEPAGAVETTAPLPVVDGAVASTVLGRVARRWLPASLRGARFDPGRRGAAMLALVAAAAAVVASVAVWRDQPVVQQSPPLVSVVGAEQQPQAADRAAAPAAPSMLVVSVVGKVRHPGLVTVPAGARVADAIGKAGGVLPGADLSVLNLARRLGDGEQIPVGLPPAAVASDVPAGPDASAGKAGPLDLNHASVAQLDALPGVGPVTAQRIVDWRAAHGRFSSVDQLREIAGIGERKFGQLKGLVTK